MNMLSRYIHLRCTSNQTYRKYSSDKDFIHQLKWNRDMFALTNLDGLIDKGQVLLPLLYGAQEGSNETAARHALQVHCIVVHIQQDFIHSTQDGRSLLGAFKIGLHNELHVFPGLLHLLHSLEAHKPHTCGRFPL